MLLCQRLPLRWRSLVGLTRSLSLPERLLEPQPQPRHQWTRTCFHPGVSGLARDRTDQTGERKVTGVEMIKVITRDESLSYPHHFYIEPGYLHLAGR